MSVIGIAFSNRSAISWGRAKTKGKLWLKGALYLQFRAQLLRTLRQEIGIRSLENAPFPLSSTVRVWRVGRTMSCIQEVITAPHCKLGIPNNIYLWSQLSATLVCATYFGDECLKFTDDLGRAREMAPQHTQSFLHGGLAVVWVDGHTLVYFFEFRCCWTRRFWTCAFWYANEHSDDLQHEVVRIEWVPGETQWNIQSFNITPLDAPFSKTQKPHNPNPLPPPFSQPCKEKLYMWGSK